MTGKQKLDPGVGKGLYAGEPSGPTARCVSYRTVDLASRVYYLPVAVSSQTELPCKQPVLCMRAVP